MSVMVSLVKEKKLFHSFVERKETLSFLSVKRYCEAPVIFAKRLK